MTQKRSALALLAGALEHRRAQVKTALGKDEADLFRIANQFGIRDRRADQQTEYGEEFLDYMFGAFLSAVTLMEALELREGGRRSGARLSRIVTAGVPPGSTMRQVGLESVVDTAGLTGERPLTARIGIER